MSESSSITSQQINPSTAKVTFDDEIGFKELTRILWRGKGLIALCTLLCTVGAGVAAWVTKDSYEATVLLLPATDENGRLGSASSALGQVGGLASLVGLSSSSDNKKAESLAVLQSDALTQRYIAKNNLLPVLYSELWDADSGKWKTQDPKKIPTLWKASRFFKKEIRKVNEDKKSRLVTLTITWKDPKTAAQWANDLVDQTNDELRSRAIRESERNIAFLNQEVLKTNVVEMQKAIYSILEAEIKKVMLARGSDEFALRIVDPAIAPEKPQSPRRLFWIIAGLIGGLFLGLFVVIGHAAWAKAG